MKRRCAIAFIMLVCNALMIYSQISPDKYQKYLTYFIKDCHQASSVLPFKVRMGNAWIDMEEKYLFLAEFFILDGDTTLLMYDENPVTEYYPSNDSLVTVIAGHRALFDFRAVGCFDYKDFMVVVYSFPLDDPNYYQCYTVNTYTKDGKRIDRLPFFMWRRDIDAEEFGDELDPSWLEMTGYIDEDFEITICQRTKWSVIHSRDGIDFSKEYFKEQEEMRAHREYHVYRIDETGHFEEVKKKNLFEVDDNNTWTRKLAR